MAGLDADDIACLPTLDRSEKQIWAEMLADRLTRGRTVEPSGSPIRKGLGTSEFNMDSLEFLPVQLRLDQVAIRLKYCNSLLNLRRAQAQRVAF